MPAAVPAAVPPAGSALRRALRRAADGVALNTAEAAVLLQARGEDLARLCEAAARVRDARLLAEGRPGTVTYSRKVFIPLTRLCRDRCHYCTFATVPSRVAAPFLEPDEVLAIARAGAAAGCREALFTLGDQPEARWPQAARWLAARGYATTLEYLRAMAIGVLEQTGLLAHLNPGVLTWPDLVRLKPVAPSMGMMLETVAERLWSEPSGPHFASPDKEPAIRLRVLEDAGRVAVPFTTGVLIGIGENAEERAASLQAIRRVSRLYGSVQEVIVQNFRAKPGTAMSQAPDARIEELAAAVAVTRLLMDHRVSVQAPPNLAPEHLELLLGAGIDDWGGVSPVTPDHVNPERPWPHLDELERRSAVAGFVLRERLTAHPRYVLAGEPWIDPRVLTHVRALAGPDGLADPAARPRGRPWQEPDGGLEISVGRTELHRDVDSPGRPDGAAPAPAVRPGSEGVHGDMRELAVAGPARRTAGSRATVRRSFAAALRRAEARRAAMSDADALILFGAAPGAELEALCALADAVRREEVGDEVTYVVNRNINFTNVCYTGCRFCAFAQRKTDADAYTLSLSEVGRRALEAEQAGATEICMQGGISPELPGEAYFSLAAEIKRVAPSLHLHAFSPMEIANGVARTGLPLEEFLVRLREAGVDTIPGTAAEILDDEVRWVLTRGKLPAAEWVRIVTAAHRCGLRSSSTMMYGHVDAPPQWLAHLRLLGRIQDATGGFTEFVPLPFVHHNAPVYLAGLARPGPTAQENRAVHAMARLLLAGSIPHVQCSWVKLGVDGCRQMLAGGVDDLGGTLMEETISRMAGSEHGSRKSAAELAAIAEGIGRPARQRTTLYGHPAAPGAGPRAAGRETCPAL